MEADGIKLVIKPFWSDAKGLYNEDKKIVGINKNIETNAERYCVAIEERGHAKLTVGDISDFGNLNNCKQEYKARMWGYENASAIEDMIAAYNYGVRNIYELAEYLELTEDFIKEASMAMQSKRGFCFKVNGHIVCFSPFKIYKDEIIERK